MSEFLFRLVTPVALVLLAQAGTAWHVAVIGLVLAMLRRILWPTPGERDADEWRELCVRERRVAVAMKGGADAVDSN